jgi:sirohydrochlorin cobaltochelatase
MADGEEYQDLASLIAALKSVVTRQKSLHPFPYLGLGPPALGLLDGEMAALKKAALALKAYGEEAAQKGATMVFQAHGNHTLEFKVFPALEAELRGLYGPNIHIGLVEGRPGLAELKETFARRVPLGSKLVLAPLMVVAGEHAYNDLAGEGGWAGEFRRMGYNVEVNLFGLGENDQFADLYVSSLKRLEEAVLREKARVDGLANVA